MEGAANYNADSDRGPLSSGQVEASLGERPKSSETAKHSIFNLFGLFSAHSGEQVEPRGKWTMPTMKSLWNYFSGTTEGEIKPFSANNENATAIGRAALGTKETVNAFIEQRANACIEERITVLKKEPAYKEKSRGDVAKVANKEKSRDKVREEVKKEVHDAIQVRVAALINNEEPAFFGNIFCVFAPKRNQALLEGRALLKVVRAVQDATSRASATTQSVIDGFAAKRVQLKEQSENTSLIPIEFSQMKNDVEVEVNALVKAIADKKETQVEGSTDSSNDILPSVERIQEEDSILAKQVVPVLQLEMKAMTRIATLKELEKSLETMVDDLSAGLPETIEDPSYMEYTRVKTKRDEAMKGMQVALGRANAIENRNKTLADVIQKFTLAASDPVSLLIEKLKTAKGGASIIDKAAYNDLLVHIETLSDQRLVSQKVNSTDSLERLQNQGELYLYTELRLQEILSRIRNIQALEIVLPADAQAISASMSSVESQKRDLGEKRNAFSTKKRLVAQKQAELTLSFEKERHVLMETVSEINFFYRQLNGVPTYTAEMTSIKNRFDQKEEEIKGLLGTASAQESDGNKVQVNPEAAIEAKFKALSARCEANLSWLSSRQRNLIRSSGTSPESREELSPKDQTTLQHLRVYARRLEVFSGQQEMKRQEAQNVAQQQQAQANRARELAKQGEAETKVEEPIISTILSSDALPVVAEIEVPSANLSANLESVLTQPTKRLIPKSVTKYTKVFTKPMTRLFNSKPSVKTETPSAASASTASVSEERRLSEVVPSKQVGASASTGQVDSKAVQAETKYKSEDID